MPEIRIDWADHGVPDLRRKDWRRLIEDLKHIDGKVLVHCMGGHGRTGTALAILLNLSSAISTDPVKYLRENYCEKVVESEAQISYLRKNMCIKTDCEPRFKPVAYQIVSDNWKDKWKDDKDVTTDRQWLYGEGYTPNKGYLDGPVKVEGFQTPSLYKPPLLYTCSKCHYAKIKEYMFTSFANGFGLCMRCNAQGTQTLERYDGP